ncbi:flagellar basal body L-ring protein FlgH [Desulfobulbus alkaliphilus]|uniref:flagellar basal body L-ring protein FlgH n=1 Tax=Desulfobulbus alkaliphilus TaxID=869814 RepID=UPI001965FE58|nr:flagellar basal body L-ring protein FlgH [Desulfobulbus alkaliphilus]MBM9537409.1 flagellar basal body L-ring protein FlgH [Desulfobulbus alkaliphilus]
MHDTPHRHQGSAATQRQRFWITFLLVFNLTLLSSCARQAQEVIVLPDPFTEPVVTAPQRLSPGSLWTDDESNLLADIKARRIGDIVTVIIQEKASASKEASTATDRSSGMSAGISSLFGYERILEDKNPNLDMSALVDASFNNSFSGGGKTTRSENLVATLTTQVIDVYPNGNLKIQGGKSVTVNNESQIIYLTGIIRPFDVNSDNTIDSGNILNAQIAYTGKGAVSDKQKPGWLMRIFDNTWPF